MIDGLRQSSGEYVLTLDADLSHSPDFVYAMWSSRHEADITIASRYVPGEAARMPRTRLSEPRPQRSVQARHRHANSDTSPAAPGSTGAGTSTQTI